ncbi:hypothetical protein YB2330_003549 [Saitoella coloradoensis]
MKECLEQVIQDASQAKHDQVNNYFADKEKQIRDAHANPFLPQALAATLAGAAAPEEADYTPEMRQAVITAKRIQDSITHFIDVYFEMEIPYMQGALPTRPGVDTYVPRSGRNPQPGVYYYAATHSFKDAVLSVNLVVLKCLEDKDYLSGYCEFRRWAQGHLEGTKRREEVETKFEILRLGFERLATLEANLNPGTDSNDGNGSEGEGA